MILIFKRRLFYTRFTVSKVMTMEHQTPCCYSAKIILLESVRSALRAATAFKLLSEEQRRTRTLLMQSLSVAYCRFCYCSNWDLQSIQKMYISIKKKTHKTQNSQGLASGWSPFAAGFCVSGLNGQCAQPPAPRTVQYCGCTHSKSSSLHFSCY